jgi:tungstate transport system substrate-binding protein
MKSAFRILGSSLLLLTIFCTGAMAAERLKLSTTTSTENSGLLKAILPAFEKKYDCKVDIIAVGTGKALKIAENGDVDVTLVHARSLEDAFVEAGFGVNRRDVMYNDFIIIGPAKDPAGVKKAKTVSAAMKSIAAAKANFVSRGDESGTHTMEKELWKTAGVSPKGSWYIEAGQGMGEVITMANELQGYALTDRATFIAYQNKVTLPIVFQGDKNMFNPYGVIAVNPKLHPHVKYDLAMAFVTYLTSKEGQKAITDFKVNGQQLFFVYE